MNTREAVFSYERAVHRALLQVKPSFTDENVFHFLFPVRLLRTTQESWHSLQFLRTWKSKYNKLHLETRDRRKLQRHLRRRYVCNGHTLIFPSPTIV